MTDISRWHELVHCARVIYRNMDGTPDPGCFSDYVMVPLNAYQMGNLLDALTQSENNGDWHHELQDIIGVAMRKAGLKELTSNRGKRFTIEQVRSRDVLSSK